MELLLSLTVTTLGSSQFLLIEAFQYFEVKKKFASFQNDGNNNKS